MEHQIVDSHQHFWQVGRFDYPWMSPSLGVLYRDYLPSDLEPILKECNVAKTVLVQASNTLGETRWLLSLADEYDFIAGVVGWVDLTSPNVKEQLDEFTKHPKFKGVRHLVESEPSDDWLIQPSVLNGMRALASYEATYDLLVHTRHLKYVKMLLENCTDTKFVIDHMAKPPIAGKEINEWANEIKEIAKFPNAHCKLSGLVTEADHSSWQTKDLKPYVELAFEMFGAEKMMFGSDWSVCLLAATYKQVFDSFQELLSELSDAEKNSIFGDNAVKFYRLFN